MLKNTTKDARGGIAQIIDMTPLFTTDYSIGKSILKFKPSKNPDGPDSVIEIAQDHNLGKVVLLENRMHGFLEYIRYSEQNDFDFIFALELNIVDSYEDVKKHKVNIFAKNNDGVKLLYKIYSSAFTEHDGNLTLDDLRSQWNSDHLMLAIPFYDSYIYYNNFTFDSFVPDFKGLGLLTFFIQKNSLPIDSRLSSKVKKEAEEAGGSIEHVKSIYYKNKKDFTAFQVRKIIHNRKGAKVATLSKPNLDGYCSDEFSFESWLENERQTV